jgi:predicted kinase
LIVILCGLPGTGKTTLAKELAPLIDAVVLSTDKIRKQLIIKPTYKRHERELIYDVMTLIAKYLHKAKKNCILDATFNKESSRQDVIKKLGLSPNQFFIVECMCPEDTIISRLESRRIDWSDADVSIYKKMKKIYEPVKGTHITANTLQLPQMTAKIVSQIIQKNTLKNY